MIELWFRNRDGLIEVRNTRLTNNFVKGMLSLKYVLITLFYLVILSGCTNTGGSGTIGDNSQSADGSGSAASSGDDFGDLRIVSQLPAPANTRGGKDQLVAKNDLLEVDVFQVDSLDKVVRVDSSGSISLPLIGSVVAEGKTLAALETDLEQRYGKNYLQSPDITVFLRESNGQRVTVDGQVQKPGVYPISAGASLLQVIAMAGGFNEIADDKKLYVYRDYDGKTLVANYNVRNIREGKQRDPDIYGGDVIVSFSSSAKIAGKNLREALGIASSATRVVSPL